MIRRSYRRGMKLIWAGLTCCSLLACSTDDQGGSSTASPKLDLPMGYFTTSTFFASDPTLEKSFAGVEALAADRLRFVDITGAPASEALRLVARGGGGLAPLYVANPDDLFGRNDLSVVVHALPDEVQSLGEISITILPRTMLTALTDSSVSARRDGAVKRQVVGTLGETRGSTYQRRLLGVSVPFARSGSLRSARLRPWLRPAWQTACSIPRQSPIPGMYRRARRALAWGQDPVQEHGQGERCEAGLSLRRR